MYYVVCSVYYVVYIVSCGCSRVLGLYNNLMKRYDKELKVNEKHTDTIAKLNVSFMNRCQLTYMYGFLQPILLHIKKKSYGFHQNIFLNELTCFVYKRRYSVDSMVIK